MSNSIQNVIAYLQETHDRMLEDCKLLLRFPSIGADPAHADDVQACADWIVAGLRALVPRTREGESFLRFREF